MMNKFQKVMKVFGIVLRNNLLSFFKVMGQVLIIVCFFTLVIGVIIAFLSVPSYYICRLDTFSGLFSIENMEYIQNYSYFGFITKTDAPSFGILINMGGLMFYFLIAFSVLCVVIGAIIKKLIYDVKSALDDIWEESTHE